MQSVFISYATVDRREALAICEAIERRGTPCWIACRDVQPGENYQEAIVRAIRAARAMVLVFSEHANNSDEIKKELSLVSRYRVPLMALRVEDVEPSDAFAYELATRQWIDLFEDWDRSLDTLVHRVNDIAPRDAGNAPPTPVAATPAMRAIAPAQPKRRWAWIGAAVVLVGAVVLGGWWLLGRGTPVEKSMQVRLAGFERLSPDLPESMPGAIRDEITAAFSADGVIGVSTAAAPPAGSAPAYALSGTVRRDGDKLRVIVKLVNEHGGATLWSNTFLYEARNTANLPRGLAVQAGNLVRCGLFAALTYPKALPDAVLTDYLQFCNESLSGEWSRALDFAHKVVAAAPDFSWGWSAVVQAAAAVVGSGPQGQREAARKDGLAAADKAVALDPANSEALMYRAYLLDQSDLAGRETLFKQAIGARALACGCEHHLYGDFLSEVGRDDAAITEYRRAVDVLALNPSSQAALGTILVTHGRPDEGRQHIDAAVDLTGDPANKGYVTLLLAPVTHDYAAAIKELSRPDVPLPAPVKEAWLAAMRALASNAPADKASAVKLLAALPTSGGRARQTTFLLGALGANAEAVRFIEANATPDEGRGRAWLFFPSLAGVRADPSFPALAARLGLTRYWRQSKTRPDFCAASGAPAFCKTI